MEAQLPDTLPPNKLKLNIHDWEVSIEEFERYLEQIQANEVDRIRKFRFEADRKRALGGQLLIRYVIHCIFPLKQNDIQISRTEKNKPYFEVPQAYKHKMEHFNFNISHHGSWVVLAWHQAFVVGVDVMNCCEKDSISKDERIKFFSAFDSYFTEKEWSWINSSEQTQLRRFYMNWALKESYIKAIGTGLSFPLRKLSFDMSNLSEIKLSIDNKIVKIFNFYLEDLDAKHCAAIALQKSSETEPEAIFPIDDQWTEVRPKIGDKITLEVVK